MTTTYLTLARDTVAEIEVERSRFRCLLARVPDEQAARALVEAIRKEHWDARHHCTAFVIGPDRLARSNDDGEPSGTAGAPMLEVLRGAGVSDVLAVTTRWFGGIKLGTGGLARAYAASVRAALDAAALVSREQVHLGTVTVDHATVGRLENDLRARGITVTGVEYGARAAILLAIPPAGLEEASATVEALTAGGAALELTGSAWVDVPQG